MSTRRIHVDSPFFHTYGGGARSGLNLLRDDALLGRLVPAR
jgi:hypothetical protein